MYGAENTVNYIKNGWYGGENTEDHIEYSSIDITVDHSIYRYLYNSVDHIIHSIYIGYMEE